MGSLLSGESISTSPSVYSISLSNKQFFNIFFFLFTRDTDKEKQRHRQREETGSLWGKPDVGLNSPGLRPEPKADTQLLSHPTAPINKSLKTIKKKKKEVVNGLRETFGRNTGQDLMTGWIRMRTFPANGGAIL